MSFRHVNTRRAKPAAPQAKARHVAELEAIAPHIRNRDELEELIETALNARRRFLLSVVRPLLTFEYGEEA